MRSVLFFLWFGFAGVSVWAFMYAGGFFGLYTLESITEPGKVVEADPWFGYMSLCTGGSFAQLAYLCYYILMEA